MDTLIDFCVLRRVGTQKNLVKAAFFLTGLPLFEGHLSLDKVT